MSTDAHVTSNRLRRPGDLSSTTGQPSRRAGLHRLLAADAASHLSWRPPEEREGDVGLMGSNNFEPDSYDPPLEGLGDLQDVPGWIDLDRFEDWDRPTLEMLCPTIQIAFEEDLFPIAVAEDGESLPAEIHPSHPYGNLYHHVPSYLSRSKLPPRRGPQFQLLDDANSKGVKKMESISVPPHLTLRARQNIAPNSPVWPFRRFGPGPGGPNALLRAEGSRPWRPYKAIWADLGLEELIPRGAKVKDCFPKRDSDEDRADLPREGETSNVETLLQEMEDFDAIHLYPKDEQKTEEEGPESGKGKKRRRMQKEWKWGESGSRR